MHKDNEKRGANWSVFKELIEHHVEEEGGEIAEAARGPPRQWQDGRNPESF